MAAIFTHRSDDGARPVQPDETEPLLPPRAQSEAAEDDQDSNLLSPVADKEDNHALYWRTFCCVVALIFLVGLPATLIATILTKVFELLYCDDWYRNNDPSKFLPDGSIPERLCKIPPVQSSVATLNGGRDFFQNLPSFFATIACGLLADRVGRRPLIIVSIIMYALRAVWILFVCLNYATMDLRYIYLDAIPVLFGGGIMVLQTIVFVMLTDVTAPSNRTITFFRIYAIDQISNTITYFLAAVLMNAGPLFALKLCVGLQLFGILTVFALPETVIALPRREATSPTDSSSPKPARAILRRTLHALDDTFGFLYRDWRLLSGVSIYMFAIQRNPLERLQLQYIPQRLNLTIADAALIDGLFRMASVCALLLGIPALIRYLTQRTHSPFAPREADMLVVRGSLFSMASGWILMALAGSFPVLGASLLALACAVGLPAALRTRITAWVRPDQIGLLNGVVGLVDTVGLTFGGPAIAAVYSAGLQTRNARLYGLPWLIAGGIMACVAVGAWFAPWQRARENASREQAEEEEEDET